jgi:hypothetical protein
LRWRWLAVGAGGLAASVALIACGIFLGNVLSSMFHEEHGPLVGNPDPRPPTPVAKQPPVASGPQTLTARLLEYDLRLAETDHPRHRVETLAHLASALSGEVKLLAGKDSDRLAGLYGKVVQQGVVARARTLPPAERLEVLAPIMKQLQQTHEQAGELARKLPRDDAGPLLVIAAAARTGQQQLRDLMQEGGE